VTHYADGHEFGPAQTVRKGRACLSHHRRVRRGEISRKRLRHWAREQQCPNQRRHGISRQPQHGHRANAAHRWRFPRLQGERDLLAAAAGSLNRRENMVRVAARNTT
jgi:hypothetical protein